MGFALTSLITQFDEVNYKISQLQHPAVKNYALMSPWIISTLILLYIWVVTSLGPKLMKNRAPMECRNAMIVYNIIQIISNIYLFCWGLKLRFVYKVPFVCKTHAADDPVLQPIAYMGVCYLSNKIFDLLDSVFMVLRKKEKQLSFLHVYHHALMVFAAWAVMVTFAGVPGMFVITINSMVHTIMYFYYLYTALYPETKSNISWKRHITELQLIQFILNFLNVASKYLIADLPLVTYGCITFLIQDVFMVLMFYNYYKKAYLSPSKVEKNI